MMMVMIRAPPLSVRESDAGDCGDGWADPFFESRLRHVLVRYCRRVVGSEGGREEGGVAGFKPKADKEN